MNNSVLSDLRANKLHALEISIHVTVLRPRRQSTNYIV